MALRSVSSPLMAQPLGMGAQGSMRSELDAALKQHDVEKATKKTSSPKHVDAIDGDEHLFGSCDSLATKKTKGRKTGAKTIVKPKALTLPKTKAPTRGSTSPPRSSSPRSNASAIVCSSCKALTHQMQTLIHALVELGSSSMKWVSQRKGMGTEDRQHFSELVLNYIQPCASLDPCLEHLRVEIKHALTAINDPTELLIQQAKSTPRKANWTQANSDPRKDVNLNSAATKIGAHFRGKQARQEVAAMRAARAQAASALQTPADKIALEKREHVLNEAAKAVKTGAVYISRPPGKDRKHQSAEVHKSFDSWAVVNMIPAGSRVIVAGAARNCGGVVMMPIESNGQFLGVVDLSLFEEVLDNMILEDEDAKAEKDLKKPLNPQGAPKKQHFFSRFLPQCTKKTQVIE